MMRRILAVAGVLVMVWLEAGGQAPRPAGASRPASRRAAPATATAQAEKTDPAVMAILNRLEGAQAKFPRIRANLDYLVELVQVGDTERRTGYVQYEGPAQDGPAKFRIHFDTLRQGKGVKTRRVVDYAFDGEWLTERKEKVKQMTRYQVAPPGEKIDPLELGRGPFPVPFGQKAKNVIRVFRATTRPAGKSDPPKCDRLHLKTRPAYRRTLTAVWVDLWVDRRTGLPMKVAYEDRSENVTTVVFSKIKVPKKFAKGVFYPPRPRGLGWEYHIKRFDTKPERK